MSEPTEHLVVREVRPSEYARVGEITLAAYLEVPGVADDTDYLEELADVAARAALVPVLVAVEPADGVILGAVTYVPGPGPLAECEGPDEAGFRMLAVDPAAQGRGVGRALVEACIGRARSAGKRRLVLLTLPAMTAAHRLYERMGFARDAANDWEFEPGRWLIGYAMDLATPSRPDGHPTV
jgi:GNAT superfamily N-acetyltransferase